MVPLFLAARELGRALAAVWRDPDTKALPVVAGALVLTGTLFYWRFEDWTIIESLYFCIVTLTTVGYGDFTPTTPGTQIFTIVYIFVGLGIIGGFINVLAKHTFARRMRGTGVSEAQEGEGEAKEGEDEAKEGAPSS